MDRPAVLSFTRIDKSFGRVRALSEVTVEVAAGEFVALLGLSGAGKSTLIHLVAGLFAPDSGRIAILGRDIRHDPITTRRAVGIVFEGSMLDLDQSVAGNLDYHAALHGIDRREGRVFGQRLLDLLGVAGSGADSARTLSLLNRRRLDATQAILHQPAIVVVDAASADLDRPSRQDFLADVRRALPAQTALLWATEDPEDAEGADRVVVLDRGHVLFDGAPATLVSEQRVADLKAAFARLVSQGGTRT